MSFPLPTAPEFEHPDDWYPHHIMPLPPDDFDQDEYQDWPEYQEVCCQICGVSFNISRIRHLEEPFSSSWCGQDDAGWNFATLPTSFVYANRASFESCGECFAVERVETPIEEADHDSGSEYAYESYQESEPYEYDTSPESESGEDGEAESDSETSQEVVADPTAPDRDAYMRLLSSIYDSSAYSIRETVCQPKDMEHGRYEHVAAKDCRCIKGYNGHRISVEEMSGCTTARFLIPLQSPLEPACRPQPDDEELEGFKYVLTGPTRRVRMRKSIPIPSVFPRRHGRTMVKLKATNFLDQNSVAEGYAMPFHPHCLEVYKRASLRRFGTSGLEALSDWYQAEINVKDFLAALANPRQIGANFKANFLKFHQFPRHPAVVRSTGHRWKHLPGDEWLAANPCFPLRLLSLLDLFKYPETPGEKDSTARDMETEDDSSGDPFSCLPVELKLEIFSHLEWLDVANLADASLDLRRMPPSFFRSLLIRSAPWLWEAWCDMPYSFWATTAKPEQATLGRGWEEERPSEVAAWRLSVLMQERQERKERHERQVRYERPGRGVSVDEDKEEGYGLDAAIADARAEFAAAEESEREGRHPQPAYFLPETGVDWRRLFMFFWRNPEKIKGLQNRERIWADCQVILDKIAAYRAEGRM
ncbi:uncharacterized protein DNG_01487 [Cephalotrichum gorgonifer]|uniref:F-box domain-containing protein n=1 Tax=Cephalotrichum gorgonifer TaxID=2041049 RepID=A0AAE8MRQ1_9PEZI|nr:uncharacterized protein DNG_01487 [Cephalotrichum gorgonifer]